MNPSPNDITLAVYNGKVHHYIQATPQEHLPSHTPLLKWIEFSTKLIPKDGTILEIGSGTGREAKYIRSKGFSIQCSDGSEGFVQYLQKKGENALKINLLKDEIEQQYDMIFANAVIPHFTKDDLLHTLKKVYDTLPPRGVFAFSAKQGVGSKWVNEKFSAKRFIQYWQPDDLVELTAQFGFKIKFFEFGIPGDLPTHTWIHLTVQK